MDLYEIEGKAQFKRFGIPTDDGILYQPGDDTASYPFPCVVKGQILSGKRGKAGAVQFAENPEQLRSEAEKIMSIRINGKAMAGIMVSKKLAITEEYYLGLTLDTKNRKLVLLFTPYGGMDIEELAASSPEKLLRMDCTHGLDQALLENALNDFPLEDNIRKQISDIAAKLTKACFALDATTIEINPLARLADGALVAADAKIVLDDNALCRQGDYTLLPRLEKEMSPAEREAAAADLTYIELDGSGNIGVIAGGAGIGMATVDTICFYGGKAYNFLDLGGGVTDEKTYHALHLLLNNPNIEMILINIFGGINNCAVMAEGIKRAWQESGIKKRIVVKSRGFNQEDGWAIYRELGFEQVKYGTTDEAVKLLLGGEREAV